MVRGRVCLFVRSFIQSFPRLILTPSGKPKSPVQIGTSEVPRNSTKYDGRGSTPLETCEPLTLQFPRPPAAPRARARRAQPRGGHGNHMARPSHPVCAPRDLPWPLRQPRVPRTQTHGPGAPLLLPPASAGHASEPTPTPFAGTGRGAL